MQSYFPTFRRLAGIELSRPSWWPGHTTSAQRQSLLRLIVVANQENLPLSPLMEAWAADERGIQRDRLHRLARLLKGGTSLPDAVEEIPGILRDEDVLAIRFGAQSGTLAAAVRQMLDQPAPPAAQHGLRKTVLYFCTVVLLGMPIVAFIQLKIIPEITYIHNELELEQDQTSQQFFSFINNYWWLITFGVIALLWFTFSARHGRRLRYAVFGRFLRSLRELRAADVLQKLSVATRAGRPLPGALSTLARYHFDATIRHKLLFVRNEVEQGANLWRSMTAVGLLTPPEAHVLKTAERVGNRPWVLAQLASGKQRRTMRRLQRISELVLPALLVVIGVFVLFQALAIFLTLTRLISGLA